MIAYAVSLPGVSVGMADAALGLFGAHRLESSASRGNDLVMVLHHDGAHSHASGRTDGASDGAGSTQGTVGGVSHDEDHVLVVPGAMDSSTRSSLVVVPSPLVGKQTAALVAGRWHTDVRAVRISLLAYGAAPRAGPLACLRATELRI